ncbi:MAG: FkbM family methyltransferase [Egibacteraceae bacterium]
MAAITTAWGDTLSFVAGDRSRPEWSHEARLLLGLVQPGMTVVDLGAGFGYCATLFAHAVSPTGHVYALEPEVQNFGLLQQNVEQNGYTNVTLLRLATAAVSGHGRLIVSRTHHGRHSLFPGNVLNSCSTQDVELIALDDLAETYVDARLIDLLKIDVEGAEWLVVEGGRRTLEMAVARVWVEFWPRGLQRAQAPPAELVRALGELGFRVTAFDLLNGSRYEDWPAERIVRYCDRLEAQLGPDGQGNPLPLVYLLCEKRAP